MGWNALSVRLRLTTPPKGGARKHRDSASCGEVIFCLALGESCAIMADIRYHARPAGRESREGRSCSCIKSYPG